MVARFGYQEIEEEIKHYIRQHPLSTDDPQDLTNFRSLDQSLFDKSLQVIHIWHSAFHFCIDLAEITVKSYNLHFASIDGALFAKNLSTMICFPKTEEVSPCHFPTSVTLIGDSVFYGCSNLQSIAIPQRFQTKAEQIFSSSTTTIFQYI